jgi:Caleosin related protein
MHRFLAPFTVLLFLAAPAAAQPTSAPEPTALQRHVMFFDNGGGPGDSATAGDGFITVAETAQGLRDLGLGRIRSRVFASMIHLGLSGTHTARSGYPGSTIEVAIINQGIHGSHTGTFDPDGRVVDAKLREFLCYDANGSGGLDSDELGRFHWDRAREAGYRDAAGGVASRLEFSVLMMVAGERNQATGKEELSEATLRALYTGDLFPQLAERVAAERAAEARARDEASRQPRRGILDWLGGGGSDR